MQTREVIEEMIASELKGLCLSCVHAPTCIYHRTARKEIIQCEAFELDEEQEAFSLNGLCKSCDNAATCKLPGRRSGVWHCNEYR